MWITFKSCIFAFWNNIAVILRMRIAVVNYIQILYLCILKQLNSVIPTEPLELWITFKSCIFAFWNNLICFYCQAIHVVNYIQILYLCILKQRNLFTKVLRPCCELHSNLVSLHSETTTTIGNNRIIMLWITFKSCIFAFWNNSL